MNPIRSGARWLSRREREGGVVEIGGLAISDVRPLRPVRGGLALNKPGRMVLAGQTARGKVKIWEAANEQHARFLCSLADRAPLRDHLPPVVAGAGRFLVSEWVAGDELAAGGVESVPEAMAETLALFHSAPLDGLPAPGFDYWRDYVRTRFLRAAALVGREVLAHTAIAHVEDFIASCAPAVTHPDLSLSNLIRARDRRIVSIDNELIGCGAAALFDLANAGRALDATARRRFYSAYRAAADIPLPESAIVQAFWLAREGGARFYAGDVAGLSKLFDEFAADGLATPL